MLNYNKKYNANSFKTIIFFKSEERVSTRTSRRTMNGFLEHGCQKRIVSSSKEARYSCIAEQLHQSNKKGIIIRIAMSIFDPLGLEAIIVIDGEILIQNVWWSGTACCQPIFDDDLRDQWIRWTSLLKHLKVSKPQDVTFPDTTLPISRAKNFRMIE